jgi:hypothetical protein
MHIFKHLRRRVWPLVLIAGLLGPMILPGFATAGVAPRGCCAEPDSACAGMRRAMPCCQPQVPVAPAQGTGVLPPVPVVDSLQPSGSDVLPAVPVREVTLAPGTPPAGGILQEPLFKLHSALLR